MQYIDPGKHAVYSWTDPERPKGKKLQCNLHLVGGQKNLKKLEIDLDNLEYSSTFLG